MAAITSVTFDIIGHVVFDSVTDYFDEKRRVTAVPTLDGGIVVDDCGFSYGDTPKQFTIRNPTQAQVDRFKWMIEIHNQHRLFWKEKVFLGVLRSVRYLPGTTSNVEVDFLVSERLDA